MKSLFISTKGKRDRGKQYLMYQTSLCSRIGIRSDSEKTKVTGNYREP